MFLGKASFQLIFLGEALAVLFKELWSLLSPRMSAVFFGGALVLEFALGVGFWLFMQVLQLPAQGILVYRADSSF